MSQTFCKKCGKEQPHEVTQYQKGKDSLYVQGKQCLDKDQNDNEDCAAAWVCRAQLQLQENVGY